MKLLKVFGPKVGIHHKVRSVAFMSADMSTHEMLDDVNLTIEEAHASGAYAIAGYVNGIYANWPAIVAKWGHSGKFLLSIDVQGNPAVGAQCLDIEKGDATIAQAPAWFKATQRAGKAARDLRWYPKLYTSASNVEALVKAMTDAGIARDEYMVWSAHYTGKAHICSPAACGFPQADATQWTSTFEGASLDASQCYGYFFSGPGAPVASKPPVAHVKGMPAPENLVVHKTGYTSFIATWAPPSGGLEAGGHYAVFVYKGEAKAANLVEGYPRYDTRLAPPEFGGLEPDTAYVLHVTSVDSTGYERPDVYASANFRTEPDPHAVKAAVVEAQAPSQIPSPVEAPTVVETPAVVEPVAVPEPDPEPAAPEPVVLVAPEPVTAPEPVQTPTAPVPAPVVEEPSPAPEPSKPSEVLVYMQEVLGPDVAAKLGLPEGTILFIPHMVQGA